MSKNIQCGDKVRDKISGFEGVVICVSVWNNGCVRIVVQSQSMHDGKPIDPVHFDEDSVDIVQSTVVAPAVVVTFAPYAAKPKPEEVDKTVKEKAYRTGGPAREGKGFFR